MSFDSKDPVLVAARTDQLQMHVKGTRHGYACSICHCALSIAPAGQKYLKANPATPLLCIECAQRECGGLENMEAEPAPGAVEELIADLIGRAKRHQSN